MYIYVCIYIYIYIYVLSVSVVMSDARQKKCSSLIEVR